MTAPSTASSTIADAIKLLTGLEELVSNVLPFNGNISSSVRYDKSFTENLADAPGVRRAKRAVESNITDIVMDSDTFVKLAEIPSIEVKTMLRFLRVDTDVWPRLSNRLHALFSEFAMRFFNDLNEEVLDTVFNKPAVKQALGDVLLKIQTDLFTLGWSVLSVPKNILKWLLEDSVWGSLYNPALATTKRHHVNKAAMNRLPQRIAQNSTDILPFSRLDIDGGNLLEYYNVKTCSRVFMFQPTSQHCIALEKHFRTFVLLNPYASPENGRITTGLYGVYKEWSRFRASLTDFERATHYLSTPIIVTNYAPGNLKINDMTSEELLPTINRIDGDWATMSLQEKEYQALMASNRAVTPAQARALHTMLMKGATSEASKRPGVLTETRQQLLNGIPNVTNKGQRAITLQETSAVEHDKMEYDVYDMPRDIGEQRSKITVLLPPGTEFKKIEMPQPNKDAVLMAEARYNQRVDALFDLIITANSPMVSGALGGGRGANTATHIQASEMEQFRSQGDAMKFLAQIFDNIYIEFGAMLDQIGLVGTIATIKEDMRTAGLIEILRTHITESISLAGATVDDVMQYLVDTSVRKELKKYSPKRGKKLLPGKEGAQLIALTLDNFKQLDSIIQASRGLERIEMILYRALSQGASGNLHLRFERHMEQFVKQQLIEEKMNDVGDPVPGSGSAKEVNIEKYPKLEIMKASEFDPSTQGDGSISSLAIRNKPKEK